MPRQRTGRRGRGEGSITQLPDGRWQARVSLPNGQRRAYYAATRAAAADKLTDALKERKDGLPLPGSRLTLAIHLTAWLETMRGEVRPGSWRRYEEAVRLQIVPELGKKPLSRLTPDDLRLFFQQLLDQEYAVATVRRIRATLRSALQQAMRDGKVARNVAALTRAPKARQGAEPRAMKTLTREQAKALLAAAKGDRLEAVYHLALATGMRQGEILALHWADVDLSRGTLRVVGTLQRTPDGFTISAPKTDRSRRVIDLTPETVAAIRRRKAIQGAERLKAGSAWSDTGLVFTSEIGTPIEKQNLMRRSFWPLLAKIGLAETLTHTEKRMRRGEEVDVAVVELRPLLRFHDLRHTAATLLLEQGTHPAIVAAMLGHAQASITLNVYSHVLPTIMKEAARAMHEILS